MIDTIHQYEMELKAKFLAIKPFDQKYKYFQYQSYFNYREVEVRKDEWLYIQRVSINEKGEVIGLFEAELKQPEFYVKSLMILSFTDNDKIILTRDLLRFIDLLFLDYKVNKIKWSVTIGNPAEKLYNKFIEKYNGRIVGVYEDDIMLLDRELYSKKLYELTREKYIMSKVIT